MNREEKELLLRNLLFFKSKQNREFAGNEEMLKKSESISAAIEKMIHNGQIKDMLGVEAVYFYCMDQREVETSKLNEYANEIAHFLN